MSKSVHFVLVHGACHGAWCWEEIAPRLERAGHRVTAPDLPGHGADAGADPLAQSLPDYVAHLCRVLDRIGEKVVLVGHSLGGLTITQAGEDRTEKIAALVYVTAFMPANGESIIDRRHDNSGSRLTAYRRWIEGPDGNNAGYVFAPEGLPDLFYNQCSAAQIARIVPRLCPEPIAPQAVPQRTSAARWGSLPRIYIECLQDHCLTIGYQRAMQAAQPCGEVHTLDSDHSPMYSHPDELTGILLKIADKYGP